MMSQENLIDTVEHRLKFDKDKLEGGDLGKIEVDSFNLTDFWAQFGTAVQSLSNEVTKIGFMCGKMPFPKSNEVNSMLQDMFQCYILMKNLFLVLPENVGSVLYKAVTAAVLAIISALLDIVHSLNDLSEKGAKERLTLTGTFWDACNAVECLPRNNFQALLKVIDGEIALAADALEELNTTIEEDRVQLSQIGDVDNSDLWTKPERDLATKALGLVKVTHVCLQKLRKAIADCGSCSTPLHCTQLDLIADRVRTVSPALDDFVTELYHPINFSIALENAGLLVEVLRTLLSSVKGSHYEEGINKDKVNNLLHFISHNHHKLDPAAADPLPQFSNLTFNT